MKTHVTISADGYVVSDDKAMEFATTRIGFIYVNDVDHVSVGTGVMLNAFRVLRVRGDIDELTITFCNGKTVTTDKNGMVADWPEDPILDAEMMMLAELAGWN